MADAGMSDGARDTAMPGPAVTAGGMGAAVSRPDNGGPQAPALQPRLDAVAQIADPDLRQQVEANVRLGTARQIAAFTAGQRQAKAQAKAVIDQGGDLNSIPAKLMLQVDAPGRQALRDYAMAHGNPATDPVAYYSLKNQALDDPAGFQAVDLANHMARLNARDYGELQQLQSSLHNGQPPADLPLQQAYKANTDQLLRQLGLPTGTMASPDVAENDDTQHARQATLLRQAIDQHVAATEIATGRKMTPDDHQRLLQRISDTLPILRKSDAGSQYDLAGGEKLGDDSDHPQPSLGIGDTGQLEGSEKSDTAATPPVDDSDAARKRYMLAGGGGQFAVSDNPEAKNYWPLIEDPQASPVLKYHQEIEAAAQETGVDANLLRAIMYMETTHGGYDRFLDALGWNKSILPMNVNVKYWGDHFGSREQLHNPYQNILAGAKMLKAIENNVLPGTSVAKIATLYNNHRARSVSDYGARVAHIYENKIWQNPPAPRLPRMPKLFK